MVLACKPLLYLSMRIVSLKFSSETKKFNEDPIDKEISGVFFVWIGNITLMGDAVLCKPVVDKFFCNGITGMTIVCKLSLCKTYRVWVQTHSLNRLIPCAKQVSYTSVMRTLSFYWNSFILEIEIFYPVSKRCFINNLRLPFALFGAVLLYSLKFLTTDAAVTLSRYFLWEFCIINRHRATAGTVYLRGADCTGGTLESFIA